jgi:hypothetical protein
MFHHRSSEFDPRLSAIAGHLRACERHSRNIRVTAQRCRVEHIADTNHPRVPLIIAADLTTAGNAAIAC